MNTIEFKENDQALIYKVADDQRSKYEAGKHPNVNIGDIYTGIPIGTGVQEGHKFGLNLGGKLFVTSTVLDVYDNKTFATKNSMYFVAAQVKKPSKGVQIIHKSGKRGVITNLNTCDLTGFTAVYVQFEQQGHNPPVVCDVTNLFELT